MIFLHYDRIGSFENIWVAVLSGSPEAGGSGVALRGYYESEVMFGPTEAVSYCRAVHTIDDIPEDILASWAEYTLKKGIN